MKKKHTGLKVFLSILAIIIVVPVALVYALGYDSSGTAPSEDTSFNKETVMKDAVSASLDNTKSTGKMDIAISEDNLNQLLISALKDKTSSIPGYEGAYVEITDSEYIFNLKIKPIAIFSTHVYLYTTLSSTDTSYVFKINDVKIGRLGGLSDIAINTISKYVSEDDLTNSLSGSGLSLKVSYSSRSITYNKEDMAKDILKFMGEDTSSLYGGAIYTLLDSSLLGVNFNSNKNILASLNLSTLASNTSYSMPEASKTLGLDYSSYTTSLASLLNDGSVSTTNASTVYDYFMFGYDYLSSDDKTTITSSLTGKDLSSIGITDLTSYRGLNKGADLDLTSKMDEFKAAVPQAVLGNISSLGSITETDFTSLCESLNLIGTSYLAIRKVDSAYKVNVVAPDDFYVNITKDHLIVTLGLSFNGFKTVVVADFTAKTSETNSWALDLSFSKLAFGEMDIALGSGSSLENCFYSALKSNLSGLSWMSFSDTSETITMDFSSLASSSNLETVMNVAGLTPNISLVGDNMASTGAISFGFNK